MNKKILGIFLLSLITIGLASAVNYFGSKTTNIEVDAAVVMEDCTEDIEAVGGDTITTGQCTVTSMQQNKAIPIEIATTGTDENINSVTTQYDLHAESIPWGEEGYIGADFEAGRSYITIKTDMTLSGLSSIDFEQYIEAGYPLSINILLEVDGDGVFDSKKDLTTGLLTEGKDDVLKIEWAYNGATAGYPDAYMEAEDYDQWLNLYGVDDTTNAWLYSVKPGDIEIVDGTIAEFIAGISRGTTCYFVTDAWYEEACEDITVNGATEVYGIQIESLGWIAESSSKLRNININGAAQDVVSIGIGQEIIFDLEIDFTNDAEGSYALTTTANILED